MAGKTKFCQARPLKSDSTKGIGGLDASDEGSKEKIVKKRNTSKVDESPDSKPVSPITRENT